MSAEEQNHEGGEFPSKKHQFKKGRSGNPGGRPKGATVTGEMRKLLKQRHNGEPVRKHVARRWLKEALLGHPVFLKMLLDRTEGKALDRVEPAERQGPAVVFNIVETTKRREPEPPPGPVAGPG